MTLEVYYRLSHRLASAQYTLSDINEMYPYERDIYLALIYEDHAKNKEAAKTPVV